MALGFVAWTFYGLLRRWDSDALDVRWGWVVLSLVPLALGVMVLAFGFALLLARLSGREVRLGRAMSVHIESQLARYTPGKVGVPLVRLAAAPSLGLSRSTMVSAIGIEMLSFVAVGGAVGLGLISVMATRVAVVDDLFVWLLPLVGLFAAGVAVLTLVSRRFYPKFFLERLHLEGQGPLVPHVLPLLHLCYWLTWALHGCCISLAVGSSLSDAAGTGGFYVVAPIGGFLALVAPAGAGVREAILSAGVAPALGATGALAAALLSRGASVLIDVATWLFARRWDRGPG